MHNSMRLHHREKFEHGSKVEFYIKLRKFATKIKYSMTKLERQSNDLHRIFLMTLDI